MSLVLGTEFRINVEEGCFLRPDVFASLANFMQNIGFQIKGRTRRGSPIHWGGELDLSDEPTLADLRQILQNVVNYTEKCPNKERGLKIFLNVRGLPPDLYSRVASVCGEDKIDRLMRFMGTVGDFICVLNTLRTSGASYTVNIITKRPVNIAQVFRRPESGYLDLFAVADVGQLPVELRQAIIDRLKQMSLRYAVRYPATEVQDFPLYRLETDIGTVANSAYVTYRIVVLKGHAMRLIKIISDAHSEYAASRGEASQISFNVQTFNEDIPTTPNTALLGELLDLMGITPGAYIEQRPYQIDVLTKALQSLRNFGRATIEVATGGGKTEIGIALVISILNELYRRAYSARGGTLTLSDLTTKFPIALVTTTRRDLVEQFALRARQYGVPAVYLYGSNLPQDATTVVANGTKYSIYTEPGEHFPPIIAITSMSFYYSLLFILAAFSYAREHERPDEAINKAFSTRDLRTLYKEGKEVALKLIRQNITSYLIGSIPLTTLEEVVRHYRIQYNRGTNTAYDADFTILRMFLLNADNTSDIIYESIIDALYDAGITEFNADDVREKVVQKLVSSIKELRKHRRRSLLNIAREIGILFSSQLIESLRSVGINVPDDFKVRTDLLLARFWLAHMSTNILELPSAEKILDDIIERGEDMSKREISELTQQYDLVISAIAENARTITALVTAKLIFERPPMLIIIDEAHHTPAMSYMLIVSSFPNSAVLGMTATPYRGDKMDELIYGIAGDVVAKISSSDLIKSNYLSLPIMILDSYDISVDNPDLYREFKTIYEAVKRFVEESEELIKILPSSKEKDRELVSEVKRDLLYKLDNVAQTIEEGLLGERGTRILSYIINGDKERFADIVRVFAMQRRLSPELMEELERELPPARTHLVSERARLSELYRRLVKDMARRVIEAYNLNPKELKMLRTAKSWAGTFVNIAVVSTLLNKTNDPSTIKRVVARLIGHFNYILSIELPKNAIVYNDLRTRHIVEVVKKVIELDMHPVVIMTTYVDYARIMYNALKAEGIPTAVVTGRGVMCFDGTSEVCKRQERRGQRASLRRMIYEDVRSGRFKVLIGTTLLDEGIDIPEIRTIVLAYSFRSIVGSKQRIGRGLRRAPNKPFLFVIDIIDKHIRTAPAYCRSWWYCTEPLWLKLVVDYSHVLDVVEHIRHSLNMASNEQVLCSSDDVLRRISKMYYARYGVYVCVDALRELGRKLFPVETEAGRSQYEAFRQYVFDVVRKISPNNSPVVFECPNYVFYDVYSYLKNDPYLADKISRIELTVC